MTDCPYCLLLDENAELKREIDAMKMLMSPCPIPPVSEVPVRVLSLPIEDERE